MEVKQGNSPQGTMDYYEKLRKEAEEQGRIISPTYKIEEPQEPKEARSIKVVFAEPEPKERPQYKVSFNDVDPEKKKLLEQIKGEPYVPSGRVYSILKDSKEQGVQEQKKPCSTQGRKGAKLPRINMAFDPENLEYLRIMAGIKGISITRYVNALIERDREENNEIYDKAKQLVNSLE